MGFGICFREFYSMAFLKFRANKLFDGFQILDDQHVLITTLDGTIEDIITVGEAGESIMDVPGILSPGFINCHCHLELSHMKAVIEEGTGLIDFVTKVVTQRQVPEENIREAIRLAEDEMLANGIVAVGDICNNTDTLHQKTQGRIWYHNFIEASGFNPAIAEQRFQRSLDFFKAYSKIYSIPVESNSIVPHAPYSVAEELWERIIHFPGNHLLTIHNQEVAAEDEWFTTGQGSMKELYEKNENRCLILQTFGKEQLANMAVKVAATTITDIGTQCLYF